MFTAYPPLINAAERKQLHLKNGKKNYSYTLTEKHPLIMRIRMYKSTEKSHKGKQYLKNFTRFFKTF